MTIQEYIQSGAIESCVLGLADEEDMAELLRLKLAHPEVAAALEAAESWLEQYADAHAVPVSNEIRDKVLDVLRRDTAGVGVRYRRNRFYQLLAAASLLVAVSSVGLVLHYHQKYTATAQDYSIVSSARILKISLPGVAGKENDLATVYWDTLSKDVYLRADRLPKAQAGRQYQLWAIVDGKTVDAGVLENCEGLCRLKSVARAQAFAITLEKAGGSPTPTLSQMVVLGKIASS